jgi:Fe-S oxidoreductase
MSDRPLSPQSPESAAGALLPQHGTSAQPAGQVATDLCTFCPRLCSHTCPVSLSSLRETLVPQAKMAALGSLRARLGAPALGDPDGSGPTGPDVASALDDLDGAVSAAPLYGCSGCGACTTPCLYKVEPARELVRGRADAERAGLGHPALANLVSRQEHRSRAAAEALARDPELQKHRARPGDAAFLPACLPRSDPPGRDGSEALAGPVRDGRAALRLHERLAHALPGARRDTLPALGIAEVSHACAGYALYAAGLTEAFRLYAESFARQVEGYPLLVTSCSACTWLLRVGYPEHGVPLVPQVQHITELLAPYAEALPITRPLPEAAAYHDPCHLGRRLGSQPAVSFPAGPARPAGAADGDDDEQEARKDVDLYDGPRRLLERAVSGVAEFPYHHEGGRCCGAGGLMPLTEPEIAQAMAQDRLAELTPSPLDVPVGPPPGLVITSCPGCQHHLARSADGNGDPARPSGARPVPVEIRSLIEVLEEATRPLSSSDGSDGSDGAP